MSKYDGTKKYWLQVKEDWYDDDTIKWLEEQPSGTEYSNFFMKLCLKSLKLDGFLIRKVGELLIPYDAQALAELTRTRIEIVKNGIRIFEKIGLIKVFDDGAIYIDRVQKLLNYTTAGAEKKQIQRQANNEVDKLADKCPPQLTTIQLTTTDTITTTHKGAKAPLSSNADCAKEIIDYLNKKINGSYKHNTPKTLKNISGRIKEGFTVEDFKTVIDFKYSEWWNDNKMRQFLRPDTLFIPKFESYLQNAKLAGASSQEELKAYGGSVV